MSGHDDGGATLDALDRLAGRVVRLAEALEAVETEVDAVRAECERLGVVERFAQHLDRLAISSDAAEHLQDELDQLSGELAQDRHRSWAAVGGAGRPPGPEPHPMREHVSVECPACQRHIRVPVPEHPEGTDLDGRTYQCPHCGHRDIYETWDHFLEPDEDGES